MLLNTLRSWLSHRSNSATAGRWRPSLTRLEERDNPSGGLDPTFGTGGVVSFPFLFTDALFDIALQPDGKVVAAGTASSSQPGDFALARFNPDGTLDTTFGTDGRATADFGTDSNDVVRGVEVLPDGKILAAGYAYAGSQSKVALARFNPDGSLDTTFGTGGTGRVVSDYNPEGSETAYDVAVMADGRFVVAGAVEPSPTLSLSSFFVARYTADGVMDPTFGVGGLATTDFGPTDATAFVVKVLAGGEVVAAGQTSSSGGNFGFAVVKHKPDGTLDDTFAGGGKTRIETVAGRGASAILDLAVQPDGKLVAVGVAYNSLTSNVDPAIIRLNADGTFDEAFGAGGQVALDYGDNEDARGVAVQENGKVVVAGSRGVPGGSNSIVVRLNADGTLDDTFGTGGATVTDLAPSDNDGFEAVLLQPDGKILAGGTAGGGSIRNFGLARYIAADPTPPVPTLFLDTSGGFVAGNSVGGAVIFDQPVDGFALGDITFTNATVTNFTAASPSAYTFTLTPTKAGAVTLELAAGVAVNANGQGNTAASLTRTAATPVKVSLIYLDGASNLVAGNATGAAIFFNSIIGTFDATKLKATNGTIANVVKVDNVLMFTLTPTKAGTMTIEVPDGTMLDVPGSPNLAATANYSVATPVRVSLIYVQGADALLAGHATGVAVFFNSIVPTFDASKVKVTNGTISTFVRVDNVLSFVLIPTAPGQVSITIEAGTAFDAPGSPNLVGGPDFFTVG